MDLFYHSEVISNSFHPIDQQQLIYFYPNTLLSPLNDALAW